MQTERDRQKLIELLNSSFEKQYEKRGLLTAPHTADDLLANGVTVQPVFCPSCGDRQKQEERHGE